LRRIGIEREPDSSIFDDEPDTSTEAGELDAVTHAQDAAISDV
jgi:hypothetical protein